MTIQTPLSERSHRDHTVGTGSGKAGQEPKAPMTQSYFVPVVQECRVGGGPVQANCKSCGGGGLQESASVHLFSLNQLMSLQSSGRLLRRIA